MDPLFSSPAFKVYAGLCAVLVLKLFALSFATAGGRGVTKVQVNPEDQRLLGGELRSSDADIVARLKRAHLNALENELPFMILCGLFVALGAGQGAVQAYGYTFVAARLVHSGAYALGMQPFRTLAFLVGALCSIGMSTQILMAVLT